MTATATDKARRKQTSAIAVAADTRFLLSIESSYIFCFLSYKFATYVFFGIRQQLPKVSKVADRIVSGRQDPWQTGNLSRR